MSMHAKRLVSIRPTLLTHFFSFVVLVSIAASASVNRTIDDQKGDSVSGAVPLYLPTAGTVTWNIGQTCTICTIRGGGDPIDVDEVFDGTWHDMTSDGKPGGPDLIIQASFTGHAVYVYHIILNALIPGQATATNLAFYIDNEYVGAYTHQPGDGTIPPVLYQVPVYSNDSLTQGEHLIQIITSGETAAVVLFDYIEYTTEEDDPLPSVAPPTHASVPSTTSQASVSSPAAQMSASSAASATNAPSAAVQASHPPSSQESASSLASRTTAISDSAAQPDGTSYASQANVPSSIPQPNTTSPPPSPDHQQTRPSHVAEIAGAAAGGVAALAVACLFGALWRSRARRQRGRCVQGAPGDDAPLTLDKEYPPEGNHHLIASTTITPSEPKPSLGVGTGHTQLAYPRPCDTAAASSLGITMAQTELSRDPTMQAGALKDQEDESRYQRNGLFERTPRESLSNPGATDIEQNNPATLAAMRAEMSALRTMLETQQRTIENHAPPAYAT